MPLDLVNHDALARKAVKAFWASRDGARTRQAAAGQTDQGERASVTAGKNMNGFLRLVEDIVAANGDAEMKVHSRRAVVTLPGFFRPTKLWDAVVMRGDRLVASIEFKSHVGPSFGNNFNNRAEEAIGTAKDFWTAYREGAFGDAQKPFVGWLMLVEDCEASRRPVSDKSPHFPVLEEFRNAGYAMRYDLLCRKLVQEQLYSASCLLLSRRQDARRGAYSESSTLTSLLGFVSTLAGRVAAEAARS